LVAVYKNPPYPIFYDVVHHSFGLVPMLANPQYYKSKFSSTVLTSLITGGCAAAAVGRLCGTSADLRSACLRWLDRTDQQLLSTSQQCVLLCAMQRPRQEV
jgi:hypothetical protein